MNIKFITYGNLPKFKNAVQRITLQAKYIDYFSECVSETDVSIKSDPTFHEILEKSSSFSNIFNSMKGGGYWLWKPYIIYKHLSTLNESDLLYYADAGCALQVDNKSKKHNTLKLLEKYSQQVSESTQGIILVESAFAEKCFTKRVDILLRNVHFL